MPKIVFVCNWGNNSEQLLDQYKLITPNKSGIWNSLQGVSNINDADYIIVMEDPPNNIDLRKFDKNKIICFPREPDIVRCNKMYTKFNIPLAFTYENFYHVLTNFNFLGKNFDELEQLNYYTVPKIADLSCIISGKKSSSRSLRYNFVYNMGTKHPDSLDVYGKGLPWKNAKFYKGEIRHKYDALAKYRYSLCFENSSQHNYFSEKITDALLSWTIPIYWGCPNINEYFPEHSYYYVDITSPDAINKILDIIKKPITDKHIEALKEARRLILYKYNVWPTIENVLNSV